LTKAKGKSNSTPVQNETNESQNHLTQNTQNQFYKNEIKTNVDASKPIVTKQNSVFTSTSSLISTSDVSPVPPIISNKNVTTKNSELSSNNSSPILGNVESNETASTSGIINLLPLKTFQLSNVSDYKIAASLTDTPYSKIWLPKKSISFGLALSLNSNIRDASGFRAGLFTNYKFNNKLMLGASVAYAYTALNTNYQVRYNIPVQPDPERFEEDDPATVAQTQRSINDEIKFNTNYQGINTKLLFSYFPVKRLSIAAGFFGTRYIFNNANSNFDFLNNNTVYESRKLANNYGYNKYKAGPVFELQYWVKPKLNIAATFERNLIPEVKPEFWAAAKQDYLSNSFGIALQYQFN